MTKRLYTKGVMVTSVAMFSALKDKWFILNGKTTHRSVITSMTYRTVEKFIYGGFVYTAVLIKETEGKR